MNEQAKIAHAGMDALEDAALLLRAQLGEHRIAVDEAFARKALEGLIRDERNGFVLLAHGPEPLGLSVCSFVWTVEHAGTVAWLDELYVVPRARNRGIGQALIRHAVGLCERAGCVAIELEVDRDHTRAERLYEREGFTSLPRTRYVRKLRPHEGDA